MDRRDEPANRVNGAKLQDFLWNPRRVQFPAPPQKTPTRLGFSSFVSREFPDLASIFGGDLRIGTRLLSGQEST